MSNLDIISMALKNLLKRKLRTFLTILGVVIGTSSIVVMISLGLAINKNFDSQLQQISDITLIHVVGVDETSKAYQTSGKNKLKLDDKAVASFKKLENVQDATPILELYGIKAVCGKYSANLSITGIDPPFLKILGYEIESGRLLDKDDKFNLVCGGNVPFQFIKKSRRNYYYYYYDEEKKEPDVDVFKDRFSISTDSSYGDINTSGSQNSGPAPKAYPVKFVGLLKKNENGYSAADYTCFISFDMAKKLQAEQFKNNSSRYNDNNSAFSEIYVKCSDLNSVKDVAKQIKDLGYNAYYAGEYLESMRATSANMQKLLGAIGAVSLFVAAIGIANTMIMSVYERTREIGIMKVIGASIYDIKKLFLLESSTIGFFGGVLGALFSLFISYLLNNTNISFFETYDPQEPALVSLVPLWLCVMAVIFSGFIGLFSGYFPARRATKLSALVAIKVE